MIRPTRDRRLGFEVWGRLFGTEGTAGRQRLGLGPELPSPRHARVWFHGVSVGEVQSLAPLIAAVREMRPELEVVVSTRTGPGLERAKRLFRSIGEVCYAPVDTPWTVASAFRRIRPDLVVLSESELWPFFLRRGAGAGGVLVVNGRISDDTLRRGLRVRPLYEWLLSHVALAGVQSGLDRERICHLGMDPSRVRVTGNTKFDRKVPAMASKEQRWWRGLLGLGASPVLVAGSTFPGEEQILADALLKVRARRPDARMIVAPRDIRRAEAVLEVLERRGLRAILRSRAVSYPQPDAVVLDTGGELARLYGLGSLAFVGRSLTRGGGQSPIEPMAMGLPVLHGARMENFRDIVEEAASAGAARSVSDVDDLAGAWSGILEDPGLRTRMGTAGRRIVEANRGTAARTARMILESLERVGKAAGRPGRLPDREGRPVPAGRGVSAVRGGMRTRGSDDTVSTPPCGAPRTCP